MKRKTKRFWYVNLFVRDFYSGRGAKKFKKIVHEFGECNFNENWSNLHDIKSINTVHIS